MADSESRCTESIELEAAVIRKNLEILGYGEQSHDESECIR